MGRFTSASQLPVTLASFEVKEQNNIVNLNWQTSSELNTSYFNLQHSTDGINYTTLSTVKAKGSGVNYYTSNDVNPNNGVNYYRLQVVDRIGEISYSKQIVIKFTTSKPVITLFPNPSKGVITVKGSHICHITAMDNLGRIVFAQSYNDVTNPTISLSELNRGIYHLLIQTINGEVNSSFIKE